MASSGYVGLHHEAVGGTTANRDMEWSLLVARQKDRKQFSLYWNEDDLIMANAALSGFMEQFSRNANKMYDAPFWKQIELLYILEENVSAAPPAHRNLLNDIMQCLINDVEDVFQPCPTEAEMCRFGEALVAIQSEAHGTGKSLKDWGAAGKELKGKMRRQSSLGLIGTSSHRRRNEEPSCEGMKHLLGFKPRVGQSTASSHEEIEQIPQELVPQVFKSILALRQDFTQPILQWFLGCLLLQVKTLNIIEQFEVPVFKLIAEMNKNKQRLKWTTLGWVCGTLVRQGAVPEDAFALGPEKDFKFSALHTRVIPGASQELTALRAVFEENLEIANSIKSKMLAAGSVFGFVLTNVVLKAMTTEVVAYLCDFPMLEERPFCSHS